MRTEEEKRILVDPVISKFLIEAKKFSTKYPEEGKGLLGELMLWGAAVLGSNETLAEGIRAQIMAIAENWSKPGKIATFEDVIKELFSPNPEGKIDADIIMGRFQLWS